MAIRSRTLFKVILVFLFVGISGSQDYAMVSIRLFLCCQILATTSSFVVKWRKNPVPVSPEDIKMKHELVAIAAEKANMTKFWAHRSMYANTSLDDRCLRGKDLSAGFLMYTPYVETLHHCK